MIDRRKRRLITRGELEVKYGVFNDGSDAQEMGRKLWK